MHAIAAGPGYRWQRIEAGLEDVFISLMDNATRDSTQ
jgi:hypothetical protein